MGNMYSYQKQVVNPPLEVDWVIKKYSAPVFDEWWHQLLMWIGLKKQKWIHYLIAHMNDTSLLPMRGDIYFTSSAMDNSLRHVEVICIDVNSRSRTAELQVVMPDSKPFDESNPLIFTTHLFYTAHAFIGDKK
jgi:hypothetical protein